MINQTTIKPPFLCVTSREKSEYANWDTIAFLKKKVVVKKGNNFQVNVCLQDIKSLILDVNLRINQLAVK